MTPRERLQYLADHVLPKVNPRHFDMSHWRCGTTGCAIGHGAADPMLRAEGLRIVNYYPHIVGSSAVVGSGYVGLAGFFGMPYDDALNLFHPDRYSQSRKPGPRTVRTKILKYIAEHPET